MNIGEAAAASGVSAKMIRHYELIGLIKSADRTTSGYRVYSGKDLDTLRFIRRGRDLGFSIEQIRHLLALWRDRSRASSDVKRIALQHVDELEAKMRQLSEMADTLRHLATHCHGDTRPDCPIIQDLAHADGDDLAGSVSSKRPGGLKGTLAN
ncbi:Cu(I)-responsive transcriptional regulator [Phyllobacterium salinisoli]|uniref:Cu(I)-responsive transcriptional regulator n=1 Tax=Phyllobacterium salinisoli TaxID=1899321 RepID=A0A368JZW3_9HYPH|nr:Cu(I)-responsive transcriptional regulator [Phyllobacterium salinisoli]RCS21712.1 Cu(I)-responsive transcriptional regulator [Phyllobacterium salinisoli]